MAEKAKHEGPLDEKSAYQALMGHITQCQFCGGGGLPKPYAEKCQTGRNLQITYWTFQGKQPTFGGEYR